MDKIIKNNSADILLSIGILAYNKPDELRRLLLSVLPQMEPETEIIISDNSTDVRIKSMMEKEFQNSYIRYFKNEQNIGFDRNILLVTERARGKYVWWMGHDDAVENGAVRNLLKILNKHPDISFLFVNYFINDQGINNSIFKLSKDKFFEDKNEILEEIANSLGFMSAIVIEKRKALSVNNKKTEEFISSGFMNFYLVLHTLSQPGKFYFLSHPYVRCYPTPPEKAPNDEFLTFSVNFLKIAKSFKKDFSKKSLKKILAKNLGHIWRGVLVESIRGRGIPAKRLKVLFKFYWTFPEFWVSLPFFLMPRFINVFFYKIYKKLKGNSKAADSLLAKVPWF
ncbi:glycosyltransferase family 2 protein [Candidatus Wolfebacteria bacterium]|nr:glycosyltransferase family 2 protein [Candidatus Wolfebacteria bacterium]